jgi:hypothetical protein
MLVKELIEQLSKLDPNKIVKMTEPFRSETLWHIGKALDLGNVVALTPASNHEVKKG